MTLQSVPRSLVLQLRGRLTLNLSAPRSLVLPSEPLIVGAAVDASVVDALEFGCLSRRRYRQSSSVFGAAVRCLTVVGATLGASDRRRCSLSGSVVRYQVVDPRSVEALADRREQLCRRMPSATLGQPRQFCTKFLQCGN